jgi:flagellar M-ring protein FliF
MEGQVYSLAGNRQLRLYGLLFVLVVAILSAGYYFFLRTDYTVLFTDLRPAEASAIVAQLDKQGTPYELRDNGASIAVPSDKAASTRVELAGSDLSVRGLVGFELFNESDMGLTDFAQRVNYQRALQGELARTIMMMDGIENARVHLAMPERSLFRGNRSQPKAAVTVIPRRGGMIDERRVAGIQHLVAAAVPDLSVGDVVILDESGRTISPDSPPESSLPAEAEEHVAVEQYYRARARAAVMNVLPGLQFELRVTAVPNGAEDPMAPAAPSDAATAAGNGAAAAAGRNFRLRIVLLTPTNLNSEDRALVRNAVAGAVALDEANGDVLAMNVGPVGVAAAAAPSLSPIRPAAGIPAVLHVETAAWASNWWLALAALATLLVAFLVFRPRGPAMPLDERDSLVLRIREQLGSGIEDRDARV